MTREEARQIIAIWLISSKGADGQRGYIEGWFDEDDAEAFRMAIEALQDTPNRHTYLDQIIDIVNSLPSAEPKTGECRTCKRNADNGGVYEDGRTKCPIQEHYVLLLDGYCHLYEQI